MKKVLSIAMIAAMVMAVSCTDPNSDPGKKGSKVISVEASQPSVDGIQAAWSEGAEIAAFSNDALCTLKGAGEGTSVKFEGEGTNSGTIYVLTPYDKDATAAGNVITTTFPDVQEAVSGGISADALVAVAEIAADKADFKAASGLLKFEINTSYNIKSVAISPKGSEKIAGAAKITVAATPKVSAQDGVNTVTVVPAVDMFANGTYYAAVIPQTYVDGFEVAMTDEFGRVAKITTTDFLKVSAGKALDLGNITEGLEFKVPQLTQSPWDLYAKGNGETKTTTLSANVKSVTKVEAPSYITVTVEGNTLSATFAATDLADDVRFGKIFAEVVTDEGPATITILTAQAFKGGICFFDSLTSPELDPNWKGNSAVGRGDWKYGEGYLQMVGTGEVYENYGALYQGQKFDWGRYNSAGEGIKHFIVITDVCMDGGCGGPILFNKHGYDGTYDFTSSQNYLVFAAGTAGAESLGYYVANCGSYNAMDDPINAPANWDEVSAWTRVEIGNFSRKEGDDVKNDWVNKGLFSLKEDADGVLQKYEYLHGGAMWWWNDSPAMDATPGYCGVFAKDTTPTKFRNFCVAVGEKPIAEE